MKLYHIIFGQGVKCKKRVQLTSHAQRMMGFLQKTGQLIGLLCDRLVEFARCVT
jgi:hypothetical protein